MSDVWIIVMNGTLIAFFVGILFWFLNFRFPKKHYDVMLGVLIILLSVIAIQCSISHIGGWKGMGIGFIAALVLGGTIIALIVSTVIKLFLTNKSKTKVH